MARTDSYAAALPVAGRPVVVFGGRGVALRYIAALREARAEVTVVAPAVDASVADLADRGLLGWERRDYTSSDLDRPWLVVAVTGDNDLDKRIETESESLRLWCLRRADGQEVAAIGIGSVTLVGGGPGDPGLLTVAGRDALRSADVVVTDRLAPLACLAEARSDALIVDVGKIPRGRFTPQEDINALLITHARAGKQVVRFKGGDSFLFGRGGEELQACSAAGVNVRVIPGISSALAVPAAAGIPVTHRGLNQGFTVISGHVPPDDPRSTINYDALATSGTDLVLLMAVDTLPAITRVLMDAGLDPHTPAATIADGTLASQQVIRATVATIADKIRAADIGAPAITVIGAVAGFDPAPDSRRH